MPETSAGAALLGATPLFGALDSAERERVAAVSRQRRIRRGQFVFLEGDDSNGLVVVAEGRLKLVVTSPSGEQLLLKVLERLAVVGEIGVIDGGPRSATIEALVDARVLQVPTEEVWRLLRSTPRFVEAMLLQLTAITRRVTGTTADLVFLDLPRRAAKLLAAASDGGGGALTGLSQAELGDHLGSSRQSVNAALRAFSRRGWIELSRQQVRVLDAEALARFAASP